MDFEYSAKTQAMIGRLEDVMQSRILPTNQEFRQAAARGEHPPDLLAARVVVSAITAVALRLHTQVVDRAVQVFGAAGITRVTPLRFLLTWDRALRFVDGPDEVHHRPRRAGPRPQTHRPLRPRALKEAP